MESLWQDLRYAVRGLAKSPGFTAVAVLTLALGIGANTVIFTVVDGALLRGLPYRDPGRIVHVWEGTSQESARQFSYLDYLDVRDRTRTFSDVAAYGFYGAALEAPEGGVLLGGGRVSANFFETLGVQPLLGRTFRADEDQVGRPRDAVILTYETWQSRFGGDPGVIGRSIRLTGQPFTVIGITPRGFHFAPLRDPEILVTLSPGAELRGELRVVGFPAVAAGHHRHVGQGFLQEGAHLGAQRFEVGRQRARFETQFVGY